MYFQDLQEEYRKQKEERGYRMECKQRIRLSDHAYSVLMRDMEAFQVPRKKPEYPPRHAMIQRIFLNYWESAEASITHACKSRQDALQEQLSAIAPDTRQKAIDLLLEQYESELVSKVARRSEGGNSFVISLSDEFLEVLASDECQEERRCRCYNDRVGLYIKAVVEEYANLPYFQRERIYFQDMVNTIQLAIDRETLRLSLYNTRTDGRDPKYRTLYLKPFDIRTDSEQMYNYLVGFSSDNGKKPLRIQSIRLTSIHSIARQKSGSARISENDKKEIRRQIKEKGVQYLSSGSGTQKIVVQFTLNGERLYNRLLHLRPQCTKKSSNRIYEFDCTEFQAETYFFKYGADAIILEPQGLADKFREKYRAALECYQASPGNPLL